MRSYLVKVRTAAVIAAWFLMAQVAALPALADQPYSQAARAELERQLQEVEKEIAQYEKELAQTKAQKNTLANKLSQLKKQQASLQLQIKATTLKLTSLDNQIEATQKAVDEQTSRLDKLRGQVARFLELIRQQDDTAMWYRVFASTSLTAALTQVQEYVQVIGALDNLLGNIKQAKQLLEQHRLELEQQHEATSNLLSIKTLQQQKLTDSAKEQNSLLQQTKGRESSYQDALRHTKQQAAQIRSRIYQLLDVSTQITFGQALQIAQWVSNQTGVRPAFLLAVLTQESNLGRNVGTCNRLGDPPQKQWRAIMKPERDQEPFLQITKELGMDPEVTPVSCPMRDKNGEPIGWGGAMGPAQFIPSTWQAYKAKVSTLTGKSPANPWDIRDAFVAAALKLKAGGADNTRQGEWNAAMRYFSGSLNPQFSFYGDSVQALADGYQDDINQLNAP